MKKIMSNIRIMAALLVAGAAFAACTSDDNSIDQQPAQMVAEGQHVYNLTIQAGKGDAASTRALELDGTALVAKWTAGDIVKVYKTSTEVGELTASEVSANGQTCKLKGTITGAIAVNDQLTLTYHPYDTSSLSTIQTAFNAQTGTLESAAALDCATATVTVASITTNEGGTGSDISISETSATFATETAVLKVTMTTDGTTAINATSLAMKVGSTDVFTFTPTADTYTTNGNGIVYLALPKPALLATAMNTDATTLSTSSVLFTASNSTATYVASKTGYAFAASKYYATTLTMSKLVNLADLNTAYKAQNGDILTGTLANNVKISIDAGATVTLKDASINADGGWTTGSYAGITCEGSATINLEGTNTVKGFDDNSPGIQAGSTTDHTLIIQSPSGTGKLTASGNGNGSGIGAGFSMSCGNITINSGTVTATGNTGIGAGMAQVANSSCGAITITGGTVTATGSGGAGIGAGYAVNSNSNVSSTCGTITISGGTVEATGNYGAGIGAGYASGATSTCGTITISGGTVEATGNYGAGIGGGFVQNNGTTTCGAVNINGGTVTATGDSNGGAGIGGGYVQDSGTSTCGDIKIEGGTVTATGGYGGAGIGGGYAWGDNDNAESTCGAITLSDGTVTATGGYGSAGIGGGYAGSMGGNAYSTCASIEITSGVTKVVATKGEDATDCIGIGYTETSGSGTPTSGVYYYFYDGWSSSWNPGTITIDGGLSDTTDGNTRTIQPNS